MTMEKWSKLSSNVSNRLTDSFHYIISISRYRLTRDSLLRKTPTIRSLEMGKNHKCDSIKNVKPIYKIII